MSSAAHFGDAMASGASGSSASSSASPVGAEASAQLPDLEEKYAALLAMPDCPALAACLPGLCPWCLLRCRHGDLRHALQNVTGRRSVLPLHSGRGRFILQHCLMWIIELAEEAAKGTLEDPDDNTAQLEVWREVSSQFGLGTLSGQGAGASSASAAQWLGPDNWPGWSPRGSASIRGPSPQVPPMRYARHPSPTSHPPPPPPSSELPPPPPPPPPAAASRCSWEVWGGKKSKWVPYPAAVSERLTHMAAHGPPAAWFHVAGWNRWIDVHALTQTTEGSDNEPRKIRTRPVDEIYV